MTKSEQLAWYKTFESFRKSRVKAWSPKIYKALINIIKSATSAPSLSAAISHIDFNIPTDELATIIQNIYIDAGRVFGAKAYQLVKKQGEQKAMLPMGMNAELVNEIISYFRLNLLNEAVLPISDTMKAWILEKLIEAQKEGRSLQQVADELVKHDFPKNRAILITRTEILKAANKGAINGAKKAGYKTNKIWIAAKDNRTRRLPRDAYSHLSMDGITIPIDEAFKVPKREGGYDDIQQPGAPDGDAGNTIQCRCTIGFSILRDSNGIPIRL